jgi:hypothetical protein
MHRSEESKMNNALKLADELQALLPRDRIRELRAAKELRRLDAENQRFRDRDISDHDTIQMLMKQKKELVEALTYCRQKIEYMMLHGEWYSPGRATEMADAALAKAGEMK